MLVPKTRLALVAATGLAMLLTACTGAAGGGYPSLARRPAERVAGAPLPPCAQPGGGDCGDCAPERASGSAMPVTPAPDSPPAISDPARQSRLAALVADARAAHERFVARQPQTERALAAAGAVASDSWSVAAIALADLESARNAASSALSAIDSIYAEDSLANPSEPGPDSAAIAEARAAALDIVTREDAVLDKLRARLPG